jgi:hypothetical protein
MRGCRLAWSRLVDLGSIDPGSNPGSPTTFAFGLKLRVWLEICWFFVNHFDFGLFVVFCLDKRGAEALEDIACKA